MVEAVAQNWLEQILVEHRHLRALEVELKEFLDQPRPRLGEKGAHTWAAELSQRILNLHDVLLRHFRFEERADIVEDLTLHHPEAGKEIEGVLGEHPTMLGELRTILSDLLTYSEGVRPEQPRLRRRVSALLQTLEAHEQHENRLIQRLEYRDLGTAD